MMYCRGAYQKTGTSSANLLLNLPVPKCSGQSKNPFHCLNEQKDRSDFFFLLKCLPDIDKPAVPPWPQVEQNISL